MNTLLKNNYIIKIILPVLLLVVGSQNSFAHNDNGTVADNCINKNNESPKTLIFESSLKIGYIGIDADHESDQRNDNIFEINIDKTLTADHEVWLEYELEGVAEASAVTLSINDRSSVGGYVIHKNDGWFSQKEYIRSDWLQAGKNYVQFGHRRGDGFRYGVRNVRVVASPDKKHENTRIIWNEIISASSNNLELGDKRAYVRGVLPKQGFNPVSILIGNKKAEINNGGFELILDSPETSQKTWSEKVTIIYDDQSIYEEYIEINDNLIDGNWQADKIDNVQRQIGHILIDQDNAIGWAGSTLLHIDSGVVKREMIIQSSTLRPSDIVPLDNNLKNVTGQMSGVRFLPHGEHFADEGAILKLPYNKESIPAGSSVDDIFTFYFDRNTNKWTAVQRDSIDRETGFIYSRVTHFTDFINGVISSPETPTSSAFVPTQFQDIAVANPMAGVQLMSPPGVSQHGDANLSYPIIVPPGRRGIQPSLAVSYNSGGGSGMLGEGWNMGIPSITIETRWGAPRYHPTKESEAYLLNGQQLVMIHPDKGDYLPHRRNHNTWGDRIEEAEFKVRSQSSGNFERIIRKGSNPTNYTWEVTDRNGIKYYYGTAASDSDDMVPSFLTTTVGDNVSKWCLQRVQDLYLNYMEYSYMEFKEDLNGVMATNRYIDNIIYTGHTDLDPPFKVKFFYEEKTDTRINARTGTIVADNRLLKSVHVIMLNGESENIIRNYEFNYKIGEFGKSLLAVIDQYVGAERMMSQKLSYHNDIRDENEVVSAFESADTWSLANNQITEDHPSPGDVGILSILDKIPTPGFGLSDLSFSPINGSSSSSFGFSLYLGVGPTGDLTKNSSAGLHYSFSRSNSSGQVSLIDINGDGLVDKVFKNGNDISYRKNTVRLSDGTIDVGSAFDLTKVFRIKNSKEIEFSRKVDKNHQFGLQSYFGFSAGFGLSRLGTKIESYFTDVNGDGFVDIVNDREVNFIVNTNGDLSLEKDSKMTECKLFEPVDRITIDPDAFPVDEDAQAEEYDINPRLDVVRVWLAPTSGTVNINLGTPTHNGTSLDGAVLIVQHSDDNDNDEIINLLNNTGPLKIDPGQSIDLTSIVINRQVGEGDRIYFRAQSGLDSEANGEDDIINWDPIISYTNVEIETANDPVNKPFNTYKFSEDFLHSQMTVFNITSDGDLSITGNLTVSGIINDKIDFIVRDLISGDPIHVEEDVINNPINITQLPITVPIEVLYDDNGTPDDPSDDTQAVAPIAQLSFELRSNSNVNWQSISTENISLVHPSLTEPLVGGQIPIEYKFYRKIIGSDYKVLAFNSDRAYNKVNLSYTINDLGANLNMGDNFFVSIKNDNELFYQAEYIWNGFDFTGPSITIEDDLRMGQLYCTITSEVEGLFSNVTITSARLIGRGPQIELFPSSWAYDPTDRELFSNLYRNWGHFVYNPDGEFGDATENQSPETYILESQLVVDIDIDEDDIPDDDMNYNGANALYNAPYFPMMCIWHEEKDDNQIDISRFLWTSIDDNTFADINNLIPSRLGDDNPILNPLANIGGTYYPAFVKESKSKGFSTYAAGGIFPINISEGSMEMTLDYKDMNGDRIPDIVTPTHIIYSYADGDLASASESKSIINADLDRENIGGYRSENSLYPASYSIGGSMSFSTSKEDANQATETARKTGQAFLSGTVSSNKDESKSYWVDINGDGLIDKILIGAVDLNIGYGFVRIKKYHSMEYAEHTRSYTLALGLGASIANGSFNFGVGVSKTNAHNDQAFLDLNGDGMVDYVDDGTVYINRGITFVADNSFELPNNDPLLPDPITKTKMIGFNGNAAFTIGFNIPPPVAVKIIVNPGAFFATGMSRTEATFMDVDGDGFVDFIEKGTDLKNDNSFTGDADINVHRSLIGQTNKLKSVTNLLGGSFEVDYGLTAATVDHPGGKWAMKKLTISEGSENDRMPDIVKEFVYNKGKYERCERQFLGFGEVEVNEFLGGAVYRKNLTEYHNQDVYRSGRMMTNTVLDASDDVWIRNTVTHESKDIDGITEPAIIDYSMDAPEEQVIFTAPVRSQTNLSYNDGQDRLGESSLMKYDKYGNVSDVYYSNSDPMDLVNDGKYDNHAKISYETDLLVLANNILGAPVHHKVKDISGTLRESSAEVNEEGSVTKQTVKVSCGDAVTDYMYNDFGNVEQMTAPSNGMSPAQRNVYDYEYDATDIYVEKVTDALGFETKMTYMPEFGVMTSTKSIHEHTIFTPHDAQGRLMGMSYDGTNDPDIHFYYNLANNMATTTRAVPGSEGGLMESYVFVDGLGRALGQGTEANVQGTNTVVWSGVPTYDDLGRIVSTSRPDVNNDISQPSSMSGELSMTTYDLLDRPLISKTLDQEYRYAYGYGNDVQMQDRLLTTVTDPNTHQTESYSDYNGGVWQTTRVGADDDAGVDIITQFRLDGIDQVREVIAPNGIRTTYGIGPDGKITSKSNIDIGSHSYCYSPLGLKTKHTEGNWEATYVYDYHRLTNINYTDPNTGSDFSKYDVEYKYGDQMPVGPKESRDRVETIKDISGYQQFEYDDLGAVKKHTRDYSLPLITDKSRFVTKWTYDAWNRVQTITYPDTEVVTYSYDEGGNLYSVAGSKSGNPYPYINAILYDEYGQRKEVVSGNDIMTTYNYDRDTRFLDEMDSPGINKCVYDFDPKGNVKSKTNSTSPQGNGSATYVYDSFDRIKSSFGNWSGDTGNYDYTTSYKYDGAGNFKEKNSLINRADPVNYPMGLTKKSVKTYQYVTSGADLTNQIKYIAENYEERIGIDKGLNRTTTHEYRVDNRDLTAPGLIGENVTGIYRDVDEFNFNSPEVSAISNPSLSRTTMAYQTENRLGAINIDNNLNHYFYDGAGERFLKMKETLQDIYVNGELSGNELLPVDYTFYVSPLLVIRPGSYTKHIYVGSDRIVSKIGENLDYEDPTDYMPPGPIASHLTTKKAVMETIVADNYGLLLDVDISDFKRIGLDPATVFGFSKTGGGAEGLQYFFSKDHLGSSHFMTDANGTLISHAEYMPFGETYVDWSSIDWKTPYRFTGQEQDCETGLYYYGARYYDPAVGRFLTTDPLMDMYPGWSPYAYTLNNPVKYMDPTGMTSESIHEDEDGNVIAEYDDGDRGVYQHANGTTKADIDRQREGGKYTGGDGNYLGQQEDVLDHSTLNQNKYGYNYPGPNNPTNYPDEDGNRKSNYSEPAISLAGIPAIAHDKAYGEAGVAGADGLLTKARVIKADYQFVKEELKVALLSYGIGDYKTAWRATKLGVGLGILAAPKTIGNFIHKNTNAKPTEGHFYIRR